MSVLLRFFHCCGLFLGLALSIAAQADQPNLSSGAGPNSDLNGSSVDHVNVMNGQLLVTLPLPIASPQRGGKLNFSFMLTANSVPWSVNIPGSSPGDGSTCPTPAGTKSCTWVNFQDASNTIGNIQGGVGLVRGWDIAFHRTVTSDSGQTGTVVSESNHYLVTADGAAHHLQDVSGGKQSRYMTIDGTGYQVFLSNLLGGRYRSGYLEDRQGNRYQLTLDQNQVCSAQTFPDQGDTVTTCLGSSNTTQITDVNGNVYTLVGPNGTVGTDTKGNRPPTEVAGIANTSACSSHAGLAIASAQAIGYAGYNGSTESITLCYANYSIQTAFNQTGVSETSLSTPLAVTAVLPDGNKYTFDYDSYGNLTYVGLPTGGTLTYAWATQDLGISGANPARLSRVVTSRTLNDANGNSYSWRYVYGTLQSDNTLTNTITDSSNNDTVHVFSAYANSNAGGVSGATAGDGLVETSTRAYQGSGSARTLLTGSDITYTATVFPNADSIIDGENAIGNVFATSITTTNSPTGKVMRVARTPDAGSGSGQPFFGDLVMEKIYDWGSGAPGALVKEIDTAYLWQSDKRYYDAGLLSLPASVTIKDGAGNQTAKTVYSYDNIANLYPSNISQQHVGAPNAVRGNLSSISGWLNTRSTPLVQPVDVYDTGMPYDIVQPANTTAALRTNFRYDSSGTYVVETDLPNTTNAVFSGRPSIAHAVKASYDFNTGLITSSTDQNGNVTTFNYDNMNRRIQQNNPDGGVVTFGVTDAGAVINNLHTNYFIGTIDTTSDINTLNYIHNADTTYDGLGRPVLNRVLISGLAGHGETRSKVQATYDGGGRVLTVTNPYYTTSDKTYGTSRMQYDALGRLTQTTKPDGSVGLFLYDQSVANISGVCVSGTDEAGKSRKSCSDGLGRPTAVFEDPSGLNLETDYAYARTSDGSQQVVITQKGQPGTASSQYRVHTSLYDSVGRLLSATNPETGTITYTYDDNGNLTTKTDANNVQTIYSYDQENRLIQATPADASIGTYLLYDYSSVGPLSISNPVGRVVASTTPGGARWFAWTYDSMGRVLQRTQCSGDSNGNISLPTCGGEGQAYDYIGDVTRRTYLTGYQINYTYDEAGWVLTARDSNGYAFAGGTANGTINTSITYAANGSVTMIPTPTFNYNYAYNNRFQPTQIAVGSLTTSLMFKDYSYNPSNNNGNVVSITNELDVADSAMFTYDALNRLASAQSGSRTCTPTSSTPCPPSSAVWANKYTYDDWGNLTAKVVTGGVGESLSEIVDTNNRIKQYTNQAGSTLTPSYDSAGNMTSDGVTTYTFDKWNRLTTAGTVTNVYGPGSVRWSKSDGTLYWYGPQGEVLAEQKSGIFTYYVYLGGRRLARVQSNNGTNTLNTLTDIKYYLTDALGTSNKLVDKDGKTIVDSQDFFPFGGAVPGVGQVTSTNHYKFTGQERDPETGLDNFGARYYSSALGRWISADWSAVPTAIPYANPSDPQSFNLYSYVTNNPTTLVDHTGHNGLYEDGPPIGAASWDGFHAYTGNGSLPDYLFNATDGNGGSINIEWFARLGGPGGYATLIPIYAAIDTATEARALDDLRNGICDGVACQNALPGSGGKKYAQVDVVISPSWLATSVAIDQYVYIVDHRHPAHGYYVTTVHTHGEYLPSGKFDRHSGFKSVSTMYYDGSETMAGMAGGEEVRQEISQTDFEEELAFAEDYRAEAFQGLEKARGRLDGAGRVMTFYNFFKKLLGGD